MGISFINGELWNSYAKNISYQITLNVTNEAPHLIEMIPLKFVVPVDTLETYYLSKILDRENHTFTLSARELKKSKLPAFVSLDTSQNAFLIKPT